MARGDRRSRDQARATRASRSFTAARTWPAAKATLEPPECSLLRFHSGAPRDARTQPGAPPADGSTCKTPSFPLRAARVRPTLALTCEGCGSLSQRGLRQVQRVVRRLLDCHHCPGLSHVSLPPPRSVHDHAQCCKERPLPRRLIAVETGRAGGLARDEGRGHEGLRSPRAFGSFAGARTWPAARAKRRTQLRSLPRVHSGAPQDARVEARRASGRRPHSSTTCFLPGREVPVERWR